MNLLNIFLLPKTLHQKITSKVWPLFIGFAFVGAFDILFPPNHTFEAITNTKSLDNLLYKLVVILVFSMIIGAIDLICFSWPICDFYSFITKQKDSEDIDKQSLYSIVMKSYTLTHIIFVPLHIIMYNLCVVKQLVWACLVYQFILIIIPYWSSAIILRTIGLRKKIDLLQKILTFVIIYVWSQLVSLGLVFLIQKTELLVNLLFKIEF